MTFTTILQVFGPMLVQTTAVVAVASIIALLVLRTVGCRRSWVHQFVWGGVLLLGLVGMRVPFAVPVAVPMAEEMPAEPVFVTQSGMESSAMEIVAAPVLRNVSDSSPVEFLPIGGEPVMRTAPVETETVAGPPLETEAAFPAEPFTTERSWKFEAWAPALFAVWGAVVFALSAWYFVHYIRLVLLLRQAGSPDIETQNLWAGLLEQHGVSPRRRPALKMLPEGGPAMIRTPRGYTLVLSKSHWAELDTELRRGVMRHELAHFLYGDLWKTLFARLVVLLHWFNPLARLAARRFEEAIEWSADSFSYGTEEKGLEHFAAAMLTLHETTPQNYRYRVAFGTKDVLRRLEFLKRLKTGSKESILKTGFVLVFTAILFVLGILNIRIVAQEKKTEPAVEIVVSENIAESDSSGKPKLALPRFPGSIYDNGPYGGKLNETQIAFAVWDEDHFKNYYKTEFYHLDKNEKQLESAWITLLKGKEPRYVGGHSMFYQAINGLALLKSEAAIPELLRIATERINKDNSYRDTAIKALGWIGNPKVVPELIPLVYFPNVNCRINAQIALVRLTGRNFDYDWQAWGRWWNEHRNEFGDEMPEFGMKQIDWLHVEYIWYFTEELKAHFETNPDIEAYSDVEVLKLQDRVFTAQWQAEREVQNKVKTLQEEFRKAVEERTGVKRRKVEDIAESEFPKVVSTNPPNGTKDVNPSLTELSVTFDRPMGPGIAWYTRDGGKTFPKRTKPLEESFRWSEDGKTNTITNLVLEPGKTYNIWFNSEEELNSDKRFDGFRSTDDVPVKPILYTFTTAAAPKTENPKISDPLALPEKWTVVVRDEADQPVPDVKLHLNIHVDSLGIRNIDKMTGSDGTNVYDLSEFSDKSFETFRFWLEKPGYIPIFSNFDRLEPPFKPVPPRFSAVMRKGTKISGRVVDEDDRPIEGVKVRVQLIDNEDDKLVGENMVYSIWLGEPKTDKEGRWSCDTVPSEGKVRLAFEHPDFVKIDRLQGAELPMQELRDGTSIYKLRRGIDVDGTVTDSDGKPVEEATVYLCDLSSDFLQFVDDQSKKKTATDENGRYRIKGWQPAPTGLLVFAEGFAPEFRVLKFGDGPSTENVTISPGKAVRLRAVDSSGKPVEGIRFEPIRWRGYHRLFEAIKTIPKSTGKDGVWQWNHAPADAVGYAVIRNDNWYTEKPSFVLQASADENAEPHSVTFHRSPKFTGRVVDAETKRSVDRLLFVAGEAFGEEKTLDEFNWNTGQPKTEHCHDGRFSYTLVPRIYDRKPNRFALRIEADGYKPAISEIVPWGHEGEIRFDVELQRERQVELRVLTPDGKPATEVRYSLFDDPKRPFVFRNNVRIQFGATGLMPLQPKAGGPIRFAPKPGSVVILMNDDGALAVAVDKIEWKEGSSEVSAGTVTLLPWAEVRGTVMKGDKPWPDGEVVGNIRLFDDEECSTIRFDYSTKSDKDGRFVFERIFPQGTSKFYRQEGRTHGNMRFVTTGGGTIWEVEPGKTETVLLGGTGRPVVGRFHNTGPDGNDFDWGRGTVTITRLENDVVVPECGKLPVPPEVDRSDSVAVGNWYQTWKTTEEGARFDEIFTRFWKARSRSASYGAVPEKDGAFRFEDLPPGRYIVNLYVNVPIPPEQRSLEGLDLGRGNSRTLTLPFWGEPLIFTILPPDRGNWSDKPVELGTVRIELEGPVKTAKKPKTKSETKTAEASPMRLTVLDAEGKPIAGATGHASRVDRDNKRPGRNFKTDENGVALIERTTPENAAWACFNIKTAGYTPYFAVWERSRGPESPPETFTVKLERAKTIGGIVQDPDGKPVEGVSVEFGFPYGKRSFNDRATGCAASGKTDAEGRWTCGYVPTDVLGGMRFYLHHPDFQSTQIEADLDDLKPDTDKKYSHVFTIRRGYEINGTVKDESGKPIGGARVEIQFFGVGGSEKDMYRRTVTDAEGRYRFTTCPLSDSAAVVAQAPGFAGRYVETGIGSEPKTVDVVLGTSKPLKLRITDEKGNPVKDFQVSVSRWGPFDGTTIATPIQKMLKADNYEPMKLDDGNGRWTWNDALAGKFQVAVRAKGFMMRQDVDVEADGETKTVVLKPWLEVTGTVLDDETDKPIPAFRLAEGYGNVEKGRVSWQTHGKRKEKDGRFHYVDDLPQRFGRRLRIEADGYENCDSRLIENDEGSIEQTFRMKRPEAKTSENAADDTPRSGMVLTPDGKPAAEARILVAASPYGIYVELGNLDHHLQARADRDGRFTLPAIPFEGHEERTPNQPKRFALILVHEDGCLRLSDTDFEKNHNTAVAEAKPIRLEPWGELEGILRIGNRPGEGSQMNVSRREKDSGLPRFGFLAQATSGKDGRFSFRKLFPGEYTVSRNIVLRRFNGFTIPIWALSTSTSVASGKKTEITLGGTGRPVVGRVTGSLETEKLLKTVGRGVVIRPPMPPKPEKLQELYDELRKTVEKVRKEQPDKVINVGRDGDYGREYFTLQNEYDEQVRRIQSERRGGRINDDGSFRVEDVESGDWVLEINAYDEESKSSIRFEQPVTVPEMPGGRSDEALDLGTIRVEKTSRTLPAPVTTKKSAEMTLTVLDSQEKPIPEAAVEFVTFPRVDMEIVTGTLLESKGRIHQVKTDENGRLEIRLPKETPKSLSYGINIDGYAPAWLRWENIEKPVDLPKEYTVKLDDAQTVGGILVDEVGKPIEGAVVDPKVRPIRRPEDTESVSGGRSCTTDAQGRWIFRSIPISYRDLRLEIKHPDFVYYYNRIPTANYSLKDDRQPTEKIVLERGRTVTGTIADSDGKPIEAATVLVKLMNDCRGAISDKNGKYRLIGLPVGETNMIVSAKGKSPQIRKVDVKADSSREISLDFHLEPGRAIRVRVVDKQGKPIPGAGIFLSVWNGVYVNWCSKYTPFGLVIKKSSTDENGVWIWNEAPAEEVGVQIYADGMRRLDGKLVPRDEEYVFVPKPPLEVVGSVTDAETGQPIEKYTVIPAWVSPGSRFPDEKESIVNWVRDRSQNVASGEYRFTTPDATTKAYRIRIEAPGYLAVESRDILPEEEHVRIDFKLKKGKPIESRIFLPGHDNEPAVRAGVYLLDEGSQANVKLGKMELSLSGTGAETDETGRFTLPGWDKPFWIWVLHDEGFARLEPGEFKAEDGIRLTAWSRVEGVVFKGSKPAAGEKIFLNTFGKPMQYDSHGKDVPSFYLRYETVSDETGRFSFDYVVPGSGTACRTIEDITSQKTSRGGGRYAYSETFDVKPGETAKIRIGGRGRPVVGKFESNGIDWSQIVLISKDDSSVFLGTPVEADGRFRIEDVPAGHHEFTLKDRQGRSPIHSFPMVVDVVEIPGGQTDEPVDIGVLKLPGDETPSK